MAKKGFVFGTPKKEQKTPDLGVNVTDIVDTYVDKNLDTIALLQQENEELKKKLTQLEDTLFTQNTSIQGFEETIEHFTEKMMELTDENNELKEAQTQETIIEETIPFRPTGFKPAITDELKEEMREYAYSLIPKKHTIKFYEVIGKKFGVAAGSAYKYCKDIYQKNNSHE